MKDKEDYRSFRWNFGACIFFRLSFNNYKSCICNWNDLLTLHRAANNGQQVAGHDDRPNIF